MNRPTKPQWTTVKNGKLHPDRAKACLAWATFRSNQLADLIRGRLDEMVNAKHSQPIYDLRRDLDRTYALEITDLAGFMAVRHFYDEDGNFRTSP